MSEVVKGRGPVYTIDDVKSHCNEDDLWMVVFNKVYDLTNFVDSHPGGGEVLLDCGGVDATEAFEDVGHSDDALDMLTPYFVGDLDPRFHRPYQSAKARFIEAERRAKKLKAQKVLNAKEKRRERKHKHRMEVLSMVLLLAVAILTIYVYLLLQRLKLSKHL